MSRSFNPRNDSLWFINEGTVESKCERPLIVVNACSLPFLTVLMEGLAVGVGVRTFLPLVLRELGLFSHLH